MGNCATINQTQHADNNKKVVRQIKTPISSPLFSQDTTIADDHEWSLVKDAYKKCREGDLHLKNGDLDAALHCYKLMLHIPPQLTNNEVAALYIRQIGGFFLLLSVVFIGFSIFHRILKFSSFV